MTLVELNIRDEAVQRFLWAHLEPTDFRYDYTLLDAIKEVERQVYAGECVLWGDLAVGIAFRAVVRNPLVLEPHVMGDGRHLREAMLQGLSVAWSLGFERVAVWTQHESIARILGHYGFARTDLPALHMGRTGLQDLYLLTMTRTA
jgi:hypothetical protein